MSQTKIDFAPGGQAVIEGVLMRSPWAIAVAVRRPNGEIVVEKIPYTSLMQRIKILGIPFIRGIVGIGEMMVIGFKALNFSATIFTEMDGSGSTVAAKKEKKKTSNLMETLVFCLSIVFAFGMSLFLFKFVPLGITTFLSKNFEIIKNNYILFNLIDGILKMGIFVGYIAILLISKDMKRVFQYHGAEHKAVYTYEKKLELTPQNAKLQSRFHPRCGTSFIIMLILISIMSYTVLPRAEGFLQNFLIRVAWLPVIAGISYEFLKISARNMGNMMVKTLVTPGLWFQKLTTQEPDEAQLEVALKALENTLEEKIEKV